MEARRLVQIHDYSLCFIYLIKNQVFSFCFKTFACKQHVLYSLYLSAMCVMSLLTLFFFMVAVLIKHRFSSGYEINIYIFNDMARPWNENLNFLVRIKFLKLFLFNSLKNWKIYWSEQSFTGLGRRSGVHRGNCMPHWQHNRSVLLHVCILNY